MTVQLPFDYADGMAEKDELRWDESGKRRLLTGVVGGRYPVFGCGSAAEQLSDKIFRWELQTDRPGPEMVHLVKVKG
jgi:hypothetical protein